MAPTAPGWTTVRPARSPSDMKRCMARLFWQFGRSGLYEAERRFVCLALLAAKTVPRTVSFASRAALWASGFTEGQRRRVDASDDPAARSLDKRAASKSSHAAHRYVGPFCASCCFPALVDIGRLGSVSTRPRLVAKRLHKFSLPGFAGERVRVRGLSR